MFFQLQSGKKSKKKPANGGLIFERIRLGVFRGNSYGFVSSSCLDLLLAPGDQAIRPAWERGGGKAL
jgi:hypothetical protein